VEIPSASAAPEAAASMASGTPAPLARAAAVFCRPGMAWNGLEHRAQWWFPLLVMILVNSLFTLTLHERAMMPMIVEQWEQLVENGQMPPERLDGMATFFRSPAGLALSVGQQLVVWPIVALVLALGISFGTGFVLGNRLPFRLALEIASWSSLVLIPSYAITWALAWTRETLRGIHLGLGALVPMAEPPEKLQLAVAAFLDALGPFNLWFLAVVVIGAAALSGAPRKSVAWILGGLYLALAGFVAALAALFAPGA